MSSPGPDFSPIERLRKENSDQFFTLVRMHLSFLVDINTDDVDCSTEKPKQFRWNFHKKLKNGVANSSQSNSNTKNSVELNSITEQGIARAYELIDFLSKEENVTQEGIFRRTGSLSRQQELRQLLLTGSTLGLDEGRFSVHDCASVLKGFLAELPQPLLCDQYYQTYCTLAAQYPPSSETSEPKLLTALQLLLQLLSPLHRSFLQRLLGLLRMAADNEASNRMSPDTLATMFTPHLLCPRKLSPGRLHTDALLLAPLVSVMIRRARSLLAPPAPLLADVAAYLAARQTTPALDESVSDRTAASTIYTFVDRRRTSAENRSNPTECALAQLYAHIHSLPDSQHKRRLVKQFNRQNGYGTPIQVARTSRSLGDSIKRHIFQKGLLKTPKKPGDAPAIDEKNSAKEKTRFDDAKSEVMHKKVVLKNLANKMASSESLDDEFDSDASNESTLSDGALNASKKRSPKFISEPNLSALDTHEETPKNTKKRGSRLFRSKILSASQNLNKRYQKRGAIRGTPTSCVPCFDEQDTASENDMTCPGSSKAETPKKSVATVECDSEQETQTPVKLHYLTSTPGIPEVVVLDEDAATPYTMNFRRASMSPITKSTQKLSKAMQESIMTPRSRKPLIITSEQRDTLPEESRPHADLSKTSGVYHSMSPKNDSDFVSSDDDNFLSGSSRVSLDKSTTSAVRSENTHFVISSDRRKIEDLNTTLCAEPPIPKFMIDAEVSVPKPKCLSLSEPFREYLLSRSVLTATPVDLSILNKSADNTDEKISDSLLYCLDGNVPTDLTNSISNLAVDRNIGEMARSPLTNINNYAKLEASMSPSRKRGAKEDHSETEIKKALVEKENILRCDEAQFALRETDL